MVVSVVLVVCDIGSQCLSLASLAKLIMIPCSLCEYKDTGKRGLKMHIQAVHDGIKFPCTKCSKKYAWKNALSNHLKRDHSVIPYQAKRSLQ